MNVQIAGQPLIALILVSVRIVAWLIVVPPFAGRSVPGPAKIVLAVALALAVPTQTDVPTPAGVPELMAETAVQAFIGASMGFVTYLIFAAVQAAGDLVDVFGGFSLATAYDPLSMTNTSIFGRFYQMLATVLLFVTGAHLIVIGGVLSTFDLLPVGATPDLGDLNSTVMTGMRMFFTCAVQIALPIVAVLFVADLGLALMTKVAPQLNAIQLSFPAKIGLTLVVVGLSLAMLPEAMRRLTELVFTALGTMAGG